MKLIITVKCHCTYDYVSGGHNLNPGPDCEQCKGIGTYVVEVDRVEHFRTSGE